MKQCTKKRKERSNEAMKQGKNEARKQGQLTDLAEGCFRQILHMPELASSLLLGERHVTVRGGTERERGSSPWHDSRTMDTPLNRTSNAEEKEHIPD